MQRPTFHVEHLESCYLSPERRICPFFGVQFNSPKLKMDDESNQRITDETAIQEIPINRPTRCSGQVPISDLFNGIFTVSDAPTKLSFNITTDDTNLMVYVDPSHRGSIDSELVFQTVVQTAENLISCSDDVRKRFVTARKDEIRLLLKKIDVISYGNLNREWDD